MIAGQGEVKCRAALLNTNARATRHGFSAAVDSSCVNSRLEADAEEANCRGLRSRGNRNAYDIDRLVNIVFYPLVLTWSTDSPRSRS